MTKTGKIFITLIILTALAIGAFMYATRPVAAPSVDLTNNTNATTTNTDIGMDSVNGTSTASSTAGAVQSYRIGAGSKAEFSIDEVLNNKPFTAIGTTEQVGGTISVNTENPALSTIGTIKINARTFKTSSEKRDAAIARFILKSEAAENEFIEFTPTKITGNTASASTGEYAGKVEGNLKIAGVTKSVTFNVIAKVQANGNINVAADATIKYKDFNLTIPEVPMVASVEDEVILKLNAVLTK